MTFPLAILTAAICITNRLHRLQLNAQATQRCVPESRIWHHKRETNIVFYFLFVLRGVNIENAVFSAIAPHIVLVYATQNIKKNLIK